MGDVIVRVVFALFLLQHGDNVSSVEACLSEADPTGQQRFDELPKTFRRQTGNIGLGLQFRLCRYMACLRVTVEMALSGTERKRTQLNCVKLNLLKIKCARSSQYVTFDSHV